MTLEIVSVDPSTVSVALKMKIDMPSVAYVGVDDGFIIGACGLAWGKGRCWVWFTIHDSKPEYARPIMKMSRKLIRKAKQMGEEYVYAVRDASYASSAKLVKLAGFQFHALEQGEEVFRCNT